MNKLELREMFEEDMSLRFVKKPVSLVRDSQGMYLDKTVRNHWEGYSLFFNRLFQLDPITAPMIGRYILGTVGEEGKVVMGRNPFRHKTKMSALAETTRLQIEYGKSVYLFRCHGVFHPSPKEEIPNV